MCRFPSHSLARFALLISALCLCSCGAWGVQVLVEQYSPMKYQANNSATGVDSMWFNAGFDDSGWTGGQYGVGYDTAGSAANLLQTTVPNYTLSVYTRAHFNIAEDTTVSNVFLGADFDDGYAAWIDGAEVYRDNVPSGDLAGNTPASANHESSNGNVPNYSPLRDITSVAAGLLTPGEHVLAIGVWNISGSSTEIVLVPRLSINEPIEIIKGPYLQNVGLDHITVMWETSFASASRVDYWSDQYYYVEDPTPVTIHEITLTGLSPDTQYHYKVTLGDVSSAENTFWTAMSPTTAFRFVAYGDNRGEDNYNWQSNHEAVINAIITSAPDTVLHVADFVYNGGNYAQWYPHFFGPAANLMKNTTMFPSIGNHEYNGDSTAANYRMFFSLPGNERWYSFDYGNSHFICLDDNDVSYYKTGTEQYNWLVSDLEWARNPQNPNLPQWIFVFFHIPPYTYAENHSDDPNVQQYLVPVFEQYGVTMVFSGHTHAYERYLNNGVYYIVTGGGGAPLRALYKDTQPPIRQAGEACFHHCTVDINGNQLVLRAVRNDGSLIDRVEIPNTIPPASPTGLTATAGDSQVQLDWNDNAETDLAGYNVYRSEGADYAKVNTSLVALSDYLDTGLTNGVTYFYYVTAVDTGSNESGPSDVASATPQEAPPAYDYATRDYATEIGSITSGSYEDTYSQNNVPEALTEAVKEAGKPSQRHDELSHIWAFNVTGGNSVVFYVDAWRTASPDGDNFVFSYSTDGASYSDMLTVTKTVDDDAYQCFTLPRTVKGTVYVRVRDTDRSAGNRNLDTLYVDHMYVLCSGTPPDLPPAAPTGLTATAGDGQVQLDWNDNTEGDLEGYNVYRSTSSGGGYVQLNGAPVASSDYLDTGLINGVTYYYVVSAVDNAGQESSPSNEASATPSAPPVIHVASIEMSKVVKGKNWSAAARVTVLDQYGRAVEGATVNYTWSGVHSGSGSGSTDAGGTLTATSEPSKTAGTTTFTVLSVEKLGCEYDVQNSVTSAQVTGP